MTAANALAPLPGLLDGAGEIVTDRDETWFSVPTGGYQEAVEIEHWPTEAHPFQIWVRAWAPDHGLSREDEGGAFDTVEEAAKAASGILQDIARTYEGWDY
jgi:hypothetical protein